MYAECALGLLACLADDRREVFLAHQSEDFSANRRYLPWTRAVCAGVIGVSLTTQNRSASERSLFGASKRCLSGAW